VIHAYNTGHKNCDTVLQAFVAGSPAKMADCRVLRDGAAVFYGILRGVGPLVHQALAAGRDWFYCDNGYFLPGHFDGYFRVTRGAYQYAGIAAPAWERWQRLGIEVAPWRENGRHIVVCPPGEAYCRHHGIDERGWLADLLKALRVTTDRSVIVRHKRAKTTLQQDLHGAHALVTHQSAAALEALRSGIPVVVNGSCAAAPLATPLSEIDNPRRLERLEWFATLAGLQWTLEEFREGIMWRDIHGFHGQERRNGTR
jgi:hypothetical protein